MNDVLQEKITNQPLTYHPVYIIMADQIDMIAMNEKFNLLGTSLEDRTYTVITSLKANADATQGAVLNHLNGADGVDQNSIQPYWIANIIYAEANAEAIKQLTRRIDIDIIEYATPPEFDNVTVSPEPVPQKRSIGGHEAGHTAIKATQMWSLGYTGNGRKALIIDSGANFEHPALTANYHGNFVPDNHAWFSTSASPRPTDCDQTPQMCCHGTHVTGTVVGLNRLNNDTIGVAFNATWMSASEVACGNNNTIGAMQWAINPDGNAGTISDQPDVVNNSWGTPGPPQASDCNNSTQLTINSLEAAGIAVVTSAGNEGSGSTTVTAPAFNGLTLVNSFAVGALSPFSPSYPIAGFSSRGPSVCNLTGSLLIKPEVSAPGVNTRSSVGDNSYAGYSGTSMASPHVAGAILLLKEAFPTLTGEAIKLALYHSAVDLGTPGEDNDYGMGIIHIPAAYNYLINQGNTPVIPNLDKDVSITSVAQQNDIVCASDFIPEITIRNDGRTTVSSVNISYSFVNGPSGTFQWTGSLAPGQSQTVMLPAVSLSPGRYSFDVEIDMVDGGADAVIIANKKSGAIILFSDEEPVITPVTGCTGVSTMINATYSDPNALLKWYSSPTSNNSLGEGFFFVTPVQTNPQTYYVAVAERGKVGLVDNSAGGFTLPTTGNYLTFDVNYSVKIRSVKIYATGAGSRSILLQNANGVTLNSKVVQVQNGESRIDLNFDVPVGEGFRLTLGGATGNLFSSAVVIYPYSLNGIVNITGSNNGLYNYFYDWDVEYETSCTRTPAFTNVTPGSVFPAFTASDTVLDITDGKSVRFTNTSTGGESFDWNFGDGNTSTEENPKHNYTAAGVYTAGLSVTSKEGCIAATSKKITVTGTYPYSVGINDILDNLGSIDIIPNPTSGKFQVFFDLKQMIEADIEIFNLVGQQVRKIASRNYKQDKLALDLSDQTPGIYYLKVSFNNQQIVKKVVVRND
ncbi:MAG: S8 family serine peptidase [Bacteroidia bacterium]